MRHQRAVAVFVVAVPDGLESYASWLEYLDFKDLVGIQYLTPVACLPQPGYLMLLLLETLWPLVILLLVAAGGMCGELQRMRRAGRGSGAAGGPAGGPSVAAEHESLVALSSPSPRDGHTYSAGVSRPPCQNRSLELANAPDHGRSVQ